MKDRLLLDTTSRPKPPRSN